ncbi:MAG: polysaccharide deacetylase family protein, partial [Kineosporiaceae bacterium]
LPGSLTGDDLRSLRDAGMTIGSHGMDHRPWRGLPPEARERELVTAREQIAAVAGTPVAEAACPLGRYDRRLLADLRRLGYARVHTSDRRHARPGAWLQPRFSVRRDDTAASLRTTVLPRPGPARRLRLEATGLAKSLR